MIDDFKRARYSEVERRLWRDMRFRSKLSPILPCGQGLWLYLLTTPELGSMPGLIVMGEAAMAEDLDWPVEGFRKAFGEVIAEGMVEADWKARLVIIPKAIRKHRPQSPNVIISWRQQWLETPECSLKHKYYRVLKASVHTLAEGFREAFAKAVADPSPNQDQDQDQDQDLRDRGREPVKTIRETALEAYGQGIRSVIDGPPFTILPAEGDAVTAIIASSPRWVGLRGEQLAQVIRKSAADYARARGDDPKFEKGLSPTKWGEWLRSGSPSKKKSNGVNGHAKSSAIIESREPTPAERERVVKEQRARIAAAESERAKRDALAKGGK